MKKIYLILLMILMNTLINAQTMEVPVQLQFTFLSKILNFDKNNDSRVSDGILNLTVLYQDLNKYSSETMSQVKDLIEKGGLKCKSGDVLAKYVDIGDGKNLDALLDAQTTDVIYVCPLRALDISTISKISQEKKNLTFTGVADYVNQGVAVGIASKGGKPNILVNLKASKNEGASFSAMLLNIAKIIE